VAEFVQHDRPEEQEGGGDRRGVGGGVASGDRALERVLQEEDRQEQDEEPAGIDPDADAEDAQQLEGAGPPHARIVT
jgi:hypothetical protein